MRRHQVLSLLAAGPVLVFFGLMFENAYAADPNALAQVRSTKECHFCDLSNADLTKTDLIGADLIGANLTKANLTEANLSGADLIEASLSGADLSEANLSGANLFNADLSLANLTRAKLIEAKLIEAKLSSADLTSANLSGAILFDADLYAASLSRINLTRARLIRAKLSTADLTSAYLISADLSGAKLASAKLSGAILFGANLSAADLSAADLASAYLTSANLSGANLTRANLSNAQFEPATVPSGPSFVGATGLDTLKWYGWPTGMVLLRNAFKEAGMREQERQVTYAQLKTQRAKMGGLEGTLRYIFFEATSDWGMSPARPLWMMLGLIPVFALLYTLPIARPSPTTALWRIWDKDRARKDQGQDEPEQLTVRGYRLPLYALFFSILSAFYIGWRELNVGSWIARLNPYEFTLKGTGWVRTVSGIQSLISVYLLALAVLTYFGRPFE
jgi:uncharacterized protein YjbI with pentapeptide repeats